MSDDERPESLAAQAAAWVPPWERQQRTADREFQAGAHRTDDERPGDDEDRSAAGLSDDDDDFDPAFERVNPPGYNEPAVAVDDFASGGGEPAVVSGGGEPAVASGGGEPAVASGDGEPAVASGGGEPAVAVDDVAAGDEPAEVPAGPELEVPAAVERAVEDAAGLDEPGAPVDAPLPADGDDAGDVFDAAADDDVSDDSDVDLPVGELEQIRSRELSPEDESDADSEGGGGASLAGGEVAAGGGGASL